MDVPQSQIWLLWGSLGLLLLVFVVLRLITRPLERKLDRRQGKAPLSWRRKLVIALAMGALVIGGGFCAAYIAKANLNHDYDQMRRP